MRPLSGSTTNLQWIGYFTGPTDENEYLAKYDQVLSDKDHVAATYFFVRTTQNAFGGGNIAPWTINQSYTNQTNANVSDVHTFGATTANQAWLSFTRAAGGRVNLPTANVGQLGSSYTIQGPSTLPDLSVSGYFHAQDSLAGPVTTSDFYSLRDMVSMTKGKHSLFYGGEFALDKGMFVGNLYNYGNFVLRQLRSHNHRERVVRFLHRHAFLTGTGHAVPHAHERMAHGSLLPGQLPHHASLHGQSGHPVGHRYASG